MEVIKPKRSFTIVNKHMCDFYDHASERKEIAPSFKVELKLKKLENILNGLFQNFNSAITIKNYTNEKTFT